MTEKIRFFFILLIFDFFFLQLVIGHANAWCLRNIIFQRCKLDSDTTRPKTMDAANGPRTTRDMDDKLKESPDQTRPSPAPRSTDSKTPNSFLVSTAPSSAPPGGRVFTHSPSPPSYSVARVSSQSVAAPPAGQTSLPGRTASRRFTII